MMTHCTIKSPAGTSVWRIAGWGLLGAALLVPAVAMQLTSEVKWTLGDFSVAAFLLVILGGAVECIVRAFSAGAIRVLAILIVSGLFLWLWVELAVGVFTSWGS